MSLINPTSYQLFIYKYLGATNHLPSRVKITDKQFNTSKTVPFNYSLNTCRDMAIEYLQAQGYTIAGQVADGIICGAKDQEFKKLI